MLDGQSDTDGFSLGADEGDPEGIEDGTDEILGPSLGVVEGAPLG